jgi:hypothetical protein
VRREKGKIIVKVDVLAESAKTLGGSGGYGVVSTGLSGTSGSLSGQSVTFTLDPSDPGFDAVFAAIESTDEVEKLRRLGEANKKLVTSSTLTAGRSSSLTTSASLAGSGIELQESSAFEEARTVDDKGTTVQVTGTSSLGGKASLPIGPSITHKTTDTFTGKVGPDKKATGDASTTTSESDLGRSAVALGTGLSEHPLATVAGVVTGGESLLKQRTESSGTKLDDSDYARLVALADSPRGWQGAFRARVNDGGFEDWERTRKKIVASGGDRETVMAALAKFEAGGSGRGSTVTTAAAASGAGIRYDFPDVLADQKPTYDELVVDDPLPAARALAGAGKNKEAHDLLRTDVDRLRKLQNALQTKQAEISNPGVLAEMLGRIDARGTEIRAELRAIRPPEASSAKAAPDGKGPGPSKADPAAAAAPEQQARQEESSETSWLIPACLTFRDRERALFATIDEEYSHWYRKADIYLVNRKLNSLRAMYEQWDVQLKRLRAALKERGQSTSRADEFAPNKAGFDERYKRWNTI